MTTKSDFRVLGLAHKLGLAWETEGGTLADMNTFAENGSLIRDLLAVLRGNAEIRIVSHLIDCSAQPMIPEGWRIEPEDQIASRFQGELVWSPEKIRLHLDDAQKTGTIVGNDLKKKLEGQLVLPANVLDYLIAHPALIPLDWKEKAVFFWGTIYRNSVGSAYVRFLDWDGGRWCWSDDWLDNGWFGSIPSAVLAG